MSYTPTEWQDKIVEKPRTYHVQNNPDGTITLIPAPGTVVQEGTPVNAANLNKLEQGLATHLADNVQQFATVEYNIYQLYLQNYYDGKYPYKRGLFFDGFSDKSVIDTTNSLALIDTTKKILTHKSDNYINQDVSSGYTKFGYIYADTGQTFKIKNNVRLTAIDLYLRRVGNPSDNVICKIYNVSNGVPTTEIATSSTVIQGSTITTGTAVRTFEFNINLIPGDYAFIVKNTGSNDSSNHYEIAMKNTNEYSDGRMLQGSQPTANDWDLRFNIKATIDVQNLVYQSIEQSFSQDMNDAVLYVKSKTADGCFISADMAIYNDAEIFESMTLESTRNLGDGYQEDKFVYSTEVAGNKVKVKIILNRPDTTTEYEVNEYGVMLGVK